MERTLITCPNCESEIPIDRINTGFFHPCAGCGSNVRAEGFNALFRENKRKTVPSAQERGECFHHPGKTSAAACETCGRLLCDLCRIELNGLDLCMNCIQVGRDKQKIATLRNSLILNDSIAFNLAFWPMMIFFITFITAPASIYFAVRHLRTPSPVLPKTFFKSISALLLALGQISGWTIFAVRWLN